ncbi:MAG: LON peptidase substrate-binding domain-containing protein [Pseudobdellovibrionaceae bacterium]
MISRPLFSTINTIVFPTSSSMFIINRDFSIASVKESLAKFDAELIVASQKTMSIGKPGKGGLYPVGCLCKIVNHIELPDGTMKFSAQAQSRIKIHEISEKGLVIFGSGELLASPSPTNLISKSRKDSLVAKLKSLRLDIEDEDISFLMGLKSEMSDEAFIMGAAHVLNHHLIHHRQLTFEEKNRGAMILDVLTEAEKQKVNQGMAEMYSIVESNEWERSMQQMERALGM